jgi:uncharacterized protein (DUF2237 family)
MLHSLTFADGTTSRNVLGEAQSPFVGSHITGFYRDGYCHTDENDPGQHAIAATMTSQFLEFTKSQGNDLQTPMPQYHFAGLKPGDHWCICTSRWKEAEEAGVAPPVDLKATHAAALSLVPLKTLKKYQAHLPLLQSRP